MPRTRVQVYTLKAATMRLALIALLIILSGVTSRVCYKDFEPQSAPLQPVYQPKCGQRHISGVDVNIQKFKDGEAHFGEWPHITCAPFLTRGNKDLAEGP